MAAGRLQEGPHEQLGRRLVSSGVKIPIPLCSPALPCPTLQKAFPSPLNQKENRKCDECDPFRSVLGIKLSWCRVVLD